MNYNIIERYMSKVTCRPNAAGCCYMFYMYVSFVHNTCHYNKIYLLTYLLTYSYLQTELALKIIAVRTVFHVKYV